MSVKSILRIHEKEKERELEEVNSGLLRGTCDKFSFCHELSHFRSRGSKEQANSLPMESLQSIFHS